MGRFIINLIVVFTPFILNLILWEKYLLDANSFLTNPMEIVYSVAFLFSFGFGVPVFISIPIGIFILFLPSLIFFIIWKKIKKKL